MTEVSDLSSGSCKHVLDRLGTTQIDFEEEERRVEEALEKSSRDASNCRNLRYLTANRGEESVVRSRLDGYFGFP